MEEVEKIERHLSATLKYEENGPKIQAATTTSSKSHIFCYLIFWNPIKTSFNSDFMYLPNDNSLAYFKLSLLAWFNGK